MGDSGQERRGQDIAWTGASWTGAASCNANAIEVSSLHLMTIILGMVHSSFCISNHFKPVISSSLFQF